MQNLLITPPIIIIGFDSIFIRMLSLEIEKNGMKTEIYKNLPNPLPHAILYISEYEFISDIPDPKILFINNDMDEPMIYPSPDVFVRPFIVADFISAVSDKYKQESYKYSEPEIKAEKKAAEIELDLDECTVSYMDIKSVLTRKEAELLKYLLKNRGRAVTREELIRYVWNYGYAGSTNVVDVYIRYLREKLDEKAGVELISTIRGQGYMIK